MTTPALPPTGCPDHGFTALKEYGRTYTVRHVEAQDWDPDEPEAGATVLRSAYTGVLVDMDEFEFYECGTCMRQWTWNPELETDYH